MKISSLNTKRIFILVFSILTTLLFSSYSHAAGVEGVATQTPAAVPAPITLIEPPSPGDAIIPSAGLDELLTTAFNGNPEIASARSQWQASVEMYPQEKSLPDPSLNLKWIPDTKSYEIDLMQMIPNFRMLNLMGDKALTMAEMAKVKYEKTVRDVFVDTMVSYYELGYLNRAIEIATTSRDLFDQLVQLGFLRYSQNEIPASEWQSAQTRLAQSEYELGLLQELKSSEESKMRALLGLAPDSAIGTILFPKAPEFNLSQQEIRDRVLEFSQELKMAGISVDLAEIDRSLASSQRIPEFSLGLMYDFMGGSQDAEGMPTGGDTNIGIMFGVTIPLWEGKNRAREDQAKALSDAAKADLQNAKNEALASSDKIYFRLLNQSRLAELYRDSMLPQAENSADLAQTWYEQGTVSFSELIETRLVAENFRLANARAETDYFQSLSELQRLIGTPVFDSNNTQNETAAKEAEVK